MAPEDMAPAEEERRSGMKVSDASRLEADPRDERNSLAIPVARMPRTRSLRKFATRASKLLFLSSVGLLLESLSFPWNGEM